MNAIKQPQIEIAYDTVSTDPPIIAPASNKTDEKMVPGRMCNLS